MSKSGRNVVCFAYFDFEMCFAPQQRAFFQHINFRKVRRNGGVLYGLIWKRVSRGNPLTARFIVCISTALNTWCLCSAAAGRRRGVVLQGAACRRCCQSGRVRSGAGTLVPLQSAAAGCRRRVLLEGGAVRVVGVLWNGYWCRCRVLLRGAAAGRRCRLLLGFKVDGDAHGAALSGVCALERAYCKYRCEVPLEGVVVRMKEILWNEHAGACAGCSCQSGVGGDCVYAVVKKASVWLPFKKYCCPIWGLCWP